MYQRIRDLREDRDLTQKNMGEILNCSQRIYSNYECGDVDIPTHILIKLAEFHNTSVDYLLNLTDAFPFYRQLKTIRKIQCCIHISFFLPVQIIFCDLFIRFLHC